MKRSLSLFLAVILVVGLSSCGLAGYRFPESGIPQGSREPPDGPYIEVCAEWYYPEDVAECIENADMIFIGRVTDIQFEMMLRSGFPAGEDVSYGEDISLFDMGLFTLYGVDVLETYKGDPSEIEQVCIYGGRIQYAVDEQLALLPEGTRCIPIWNQYYKALCEPGSCYLFVVRSLENAKRAIGMGVDFAVFRLDEPTRKNTTAYNFNVYYSGKRTEYGSLLISAFDIISEFGYAAKRSFYEEWCAGTYASR